METPPTSEVDHPPMLTLPEAAALLRCHPNTVRAWVRQGKLVPIPMGPEKLGMFLLADVERLKKPLEHVGVIVKDDKHAFPVVGIGASAGGLDAISRMLQHLPTDLGLAYVVVTHQEKEQERTLAELLRQKTTLPVFVVENGMRLSPDRLYVAPAAMHTAVVNSTFTLQQPRGVNDTRHRPIDTFFTALANEYQNNAIGIVLSGGGMDGTEGLRAIKAEDGLTIAQDSSAQDPSMPRHALEAEVVDLVRAPEDIARELVQLVKELFAGGAARIPSKHDNEMRRILQYLLEQRGVDFNEYKEATIHRRIIRRMVLSKCNKLSDYATLLRGTPTEVDTLCSDLLINVTSFFRDPTFHKALTEKVFPDLFAQRTTTDPLRIWVAACAGGEEVVSIAITLLEFLGDRAATTPVQIFATDLNERTIEKARIGVYKKSALQDLDPALLAKYFMHVDGHFQVIKTIRDLCVFAKHDLLKDPPFSRVDLISCQNVLIYLENAAQARVIKSFHYALKNTGYLALGKSETTGTAEGYFTQPDRDHKVHQKKRKGGARLSGDLQFKPGSVSTVTAVAPPPQLRPLALHTDLDRTLEQVLLQRYVPASVLVNKDLEIVRFMGSTAPFLSPGTGRASLNLLKMVRDDLAFELRALLQRVRKEKITVRKSGIPLRLNPGPHDVSLEVAPIGDARDPHYLVIFREEARAPEPAPSNGIGKRGNEARDKRIAALEQELRETRDQMRLVSEEAEIHTQELQAANEEVVSSNEELQSINEEMETSKEELQSINEEYATINEELRQRNDALQESEERLRLATKTGKVGLWDWDVQQDQLNWSESLYTMHGLKPDTFQATMKGFANLVHPEDRERMTSVMDRVLKEDTHYEIEFRAVRPNGDLIWLFTNASVVRSHGKAVRLLGSTVDITERKQAEAAIRARAEALEVLNSTSDSLIAELDSERIAQSVTDAGVALSGATMGAFFYQTTDELGEVTPRISLAGLSLSDLKNSAKTTEAVRTSHTYRGEDQVRVDDTRKDTRYSGSDPFQQLTKGHAPARSLIAMPVTSRNGKVLGAFFFGHPEPARFTQETEDLLSALAAQTALAVDNADLHNALQRELEQQRLSALAEKAAHERLRDAQERLSLTLDSAELGTWNIDGKVQNMTTDERFNTIFGWGEKTINVEQAFSLLHPDDRERVREAIAATTRPVDTRPYEVEYRVVHPDGSIHWVLAKGRSTFVDGPNGKELLSFNGTVLDITERKKAEAALGVSEARYRKLIETLPVAVFTCDADGRILLYNEACAVLWGQAPEPAHRWNGAYALFSKNGAPIPLEASPMAVAVRERRSVREEVLVQRKDGSRRNVLVHPEPLFEASGQVIGAYNVLVDITDRRLDEERLRVVTQTGKLGIWDWDILADTITWTDPVFEIHGVVKGMFEPTMAGYAELIHPDDRARVTTAIKDTLERDTPYEIEFRTRNASGVVNWVFTNAVVLREQGRPVRMMGGTMNITQRKRAEEAALRLAAIVESSEDAILSKDLNGIITSWNEAAQRIFGYTPEEIIGRPNTILYAQDRHAEESLLFERLKNGERIEHYETIRVHKDGSHVEVALTLSPLKNERGELIGASKTIRDITNEKRAREVLRESEERFHLLADNMSQMAYVADAAGATMWVNQRWLDYTGMSVADMRNDGWQRVVDPEHFGPMVASFERALEAGEQWEHIFRLKGKDGDFRWFLSRSVPIRDEKGAVQRWFGTNTDITAQKLAEEALEESSRHKDHFLATLAHELRNPLAPLKNGLQLMELTPDDPKILESTRAMMVRQLDHMVRLVDDLMDLSRINRGMIHLAKEDLLLADVVGTAMEASKPLIERNEHQLNVDVSPEGLVVHGDPERLTQVISNLLNNAAKYTPRGGRIDLGLRREKDHAVIHVTDNGIGIEASALPKVFDMFAQVDPDQKTQAGGGLGIGLNVVQRLVRMHGGQVEGKSEGLGKGSEFIVRLPLVAAKENPKPVEAPVPEKGSVPRRRVLVVDDNEDAALSMSMILKKRGHDVRVAHDGEQGVAVAEAFKPEVVFMDIGMPRMNGYEACARMRGTEWGKDMHIVALSGWGQEEDRKKSDEAGFDRHIVKPIDRATLERVMAEAPGTTT